MPTETGVDLIGAIKYGAFIERVMATALLPAREMDAWL